MLTFPFHGNNRNGGGHRDSSSSADHKSPHKREATIMKQRSLHFFINGKLQFHLHQISNNLAPYCLVTVYLNCTRCGISAIAELAGIMGIRLAAGYRE
jgi:hypothetical protein